MPAIISQGLTAFLVYTMIWSVLLFMVLPFGVRPPDAVEPGQAAGAPDKPLLGRKLLITSLLAAPLTWITLRLITHGVLSLRPS